MPKNISFLISVFSTDISKIESIVEGRKFCGAKREPRAAARASLKTGEDRRRTRRSHA
ncbi:hypothetical protein DP49_349 [Burkholderia pseudomallei]|nr:hypothetical protein DP49_349 [Burkholderia pseudomallei]